MNRSARDDSDADQEADRRLDDLVDQVAARIEAGDSVDVEILARDCPEFIEPLQKLLPTLQAVAKLRRTPPGLELLREPAADASTRTLGDFRILREVGRGGMGIVYEAEQMSLNRRVAIKVLPFAAAVDQRQLQRFKNEAMAAAQLDHPHIVDVYGVGSDRSIHYYYMRFIEGHTLADVIAEFRLESHFSPRSTPAIVSASTVAHEIDRPHVAPQQGSSTSTREEAARDTKSFARRSTLNLGTGRHSFAWVAQIGSQVAEALHYAHERGIVHRDIKPSNLMIDREHHVWVTDFGLAQFETGASLTRTDDLVGTLRYMSPEQASGRSSAVNHATDIYSLGVTLYELLTLRTPFEGASRGELIKRLETNTPPPPRSFCRAIPCDLDTIVSKAIAPLAEERYATCKELAADLQRFLEQRPIHARRVGAVSRVAKWVRRHPAAVGTSTAVATLIAVALLISNLLVSAALSTAEREHREVLRQRDAASENLYVAHMRLAVQDWESGQIGRMQKVLSRHVPAPGETDRRGWEWHFLNGLCNQSATTIQGHRDKIRSMSVNAAANRLATGSEDWSVRVWDATDGSELRLLSGHRAPVFSVAWGPDPWLASADESGRVLVWNVDEGSIRQTFDFTGHIHGLAFSPDGRLLAAGNERGLVRLWDWRTGIRVATLDGDVGMIRSIAFSPDGRRLAVGETFAAGSRSGMCRAAS